MTTSDWAQELATGCASSPSGSGANASQASESCALLQQKGGKAIAGALVDFVADGPEAAEWTMDTFDFQTALCTTYSESILSSSLSFLLSSRIVRLVRRIISSTLIKSTDTTQK